MRALPKLANPRPPNSGNAATWSLFWTSKRCFAQMTEQIDDDDNDGCNDNYDSNDRIYRAL